MAGGHQHSHQANKKALLVSFCLMTVYMIVEALGGFLTHSLALLSDAGHMLSDAVALFVALVALKIGEKAATNHKTFGYKRFEVLAALFNGAALLIISLFIIIEAIERFFHPGGVRAGGMLTVAAFGFLVNLAAAFILTNKKDNINIRAVFLHVMGDLLGSLAAIIAAILILLLNWTLADPISSLVVSVLILISGFRVTKDAVHVLMEGVPLGVNLDEVIETIQSVPDVQGLHDLHIWSITSGSNALSCHVVVGDLITLEEGQQILRRIEERLEQLGIQHTTIQLELDSHPHGNSVLCSIHQSRE
ncbi:cation diffusion facilitator family transporter [Camelliibacillus cellulosilyticus]|uniref:Cation diffusion facilitator family transporter n=1 Tax=Camelliibacillus cellulosilyticus TaxID=2174486 RepID=A0ABV9GPE8_9BACL